MALLETSFVYMSQALCVREKITDKFIVELKILFCRIQS